MTRIVLVHGAWHGAWCWNEFASFLSDRGHEVRAMQLRGHDRQESRIWHRVSDYVEDIRQAVATCSALPVLVGHSMGGLAVQKYIERYPALGAVWMTPFPIHGTLSAVARLLRRHPIALLKATLLLRLQPFIRTREIVRDLFFSSDTPQATVDTCFTRLVDESYLAFLDTMFVLPRPRRIHVPILMLGAGRDGFFTAGETLRTGRAYGTETELFTSMGHDLMLDHGWRDVAGRIDNWIRCCERDGAFALAERMSSRPIEDRN